VQDGINNIFEL